MVFSRVGPNQSIEWGQIRISKSAHRASGPFIPIFFRSLVTASENFVVLVSYSVAKRLFSSQFIYVTAEIDDTPKYNMLQIASA